jgi:hypothetical protein
MSTDWRLFYEAAVLEFDLVKKLGMMQAAGNAMTQRLQAAERPSSEELQQLEDARTVLRIMNTTIALTAKGGPSAG